jgi:3-acetyloctanal synthase
MTAHVRRCDTELVSMTIATIRCQHLVEARFMSYSRFLLVVVSDRTTVPAAAAQALGDLAAESQRRLTLPASLAAAQPDLTAAQRTLTAAQPDLTAARPGPAAVRRQVAERARRFLDRTLPTAGLDLVVAGTLTDVPAAVADATGGEPAVLTLLVVDHSVHRHRVLTPQTMAERLAKLEAALPEHISFQPSPVTVQVYTEPDRDALLAVDGHAVRWRPAEDWVITADLTCSFTDSVQSHLTGRFGAGTEHSALAAALAAFLDLQAAESWGLHYYTGSVIARFIDDLERHAERHGNPVVRGPSEHSLACSALARWKLDCAPFLIAVTSGMADEFRGTLANLRSARARGFIVLPDSLPGQWHPFQGTIHSNEDSRAVMRARGLPTVHIDRPDRLAASLDAAFTAYHAGQGPVVLFVTRDVLEAAGPVPLAESMQRQAAGSVPVAGSLRRQAADPLPVAGPLPRPAAGMDAVGVGAPDGLDELVQVINTAPKRLLCQVGPIGQEALEALHELAGKAGIALVDSLANPGTVSRYRDGRRIDEYLGTLSLYGYSARVHQFLHDDGRLRPNTEQALLFVDSPIAEIDTPFSQRTIRRLRPLQIVGRQADVAPFAGLAVVGEPHRVLRALLDRLDVDPDVLALRRAAIESTADSFSDVVGLIPALPMTPNYFFRRMHDVLDALIRDGGYRYTGVFAVGRAGLSAVCNLPRTGLGYSGWFGRALMGDALQALPGIVTRRDEHVLAFIGDGAVALVPDILPALVQQIAVGGIPLRHNLTIFRLCNGSHSVIRTYREVMRPAAVSAQTGVLTLNESDWSRQIGNLSIVHRRLDTFDAEAIASAIQRPATINVYTVPLAHNNEGDGLSRLAATGWQRDTLSAATLAMVGPAQTRDGERR